MGAGLFCMVQFCPFKDILQRRTYMNEWLYVGLFFIVGLIIPAGAIGAGWLFGPKKPNPVKQSTYECGIEPVGKGWVQFKAQYYIFALVFLVFDVETVFLFPWAVRLSQLGLFAESYSPGKK